MARDVLTEYAWQKAEKEAGRETVVSPRLILTLDQSMAPSWIRMITCLIFLLDILSIGTPRTRAGGTTVPSSAAAAAAEGGSDVIGGGMMETRCSESQHRSRCRRPPP